MKNNQRLKKWWSDKPKIVNGKFLCVAIAPDGEETTELFSLEELASHLTQRAADGPTTCGECGWYNVNGNFCPNCGARRSPRQ